MALLRPAGPENVSGPWLGMVGVLLGKNVGGTTDGGIDSPGVTMTPRGWEAVTVALGPSWSLPDSGADRV